MTAILPLTLKGVSSREHREEFDIKCISGQINKAEIQLE